MRDTAVEVVRFPHRADIIGNNGLVVELQHSPISAEDISAREAFYGDMIWLFDATERFEMISAGRRTFFSLQRTKHLELCRKPVFLDFGGTIVEVEYFTKSLAKLHGFGRTRTRNWFVETYLSEHLRDGAAINSKSLECLRWSYYGRYERLKRSTEWFDPETGAAVIVPTGTIAIPLNFRFCKEGEREVPEWERVLELKAEILNGWSKEELHEMKVFFNGQVIVIDGFLRLLPHLNDFHIKAVIQASKPVLEVINRHIAAGRIPRFPAELRLRLEERDRNQQIETLPRNVEPKVKPDTQRLLF